MSQYKVVNLKTVIEEIGEMLAKKALSIFARVSGDYD